MDFPPGLPYADEAHYREEELTAWTLGMSHVDDAVIAGWLLDMMREPTKVRQREPAPAPPIAPPDALALSYPQAAAMLGYSVDHFERHVVPDLRVIVRGRRKTVPRAELLRWVEQNAARALKGR